MTRITRCGVIPSGRVRQINLAARDVIEPGPDLDWNQAIIPVDDQQEGSCVARATCGLVEAMVRVALGRNAIPHGQQLDAARLYWEARREFFGGNWSKDDGLQLDQAARTALRLGLIPPDAEIVEIEPSLAAICAALRDGPLVQAHAVGDNWLAPDEHGWIQPLDPIYILGGHATLLIGHRYRPEKNLHIIETANSWGHEWGWHGLCRMSWDGWQSGFRYVADGPYAVRSVMWGHYNGWEDWLIAP